MNAKHKVCKGCSQMMAKSSNADKYICINSRCPDYFEPAAAHPEAANYTFRDASAPRPAPANVGKSGKDALSDLLSETIPLTPIHRACGSCGGSMTEVAETEELGPTRMTYHCLNHLCDKYWRLPTEGDYSAKRVKSQGEWSSCQHPKNPDDEQCFICHPVAGVKLDRGKPPVFTEFLMQFPRAIRLISLVGEAGSKAPGHVRSGWKEVDQGYFRYSNGMARHLLDEAIRGTSEVPEKTDLEDLIWQAATVAWNDLARLEHLIRDNAAAAERLDTTREV